MAERMGAEQARQRLPELLDLAKQGRTTVITRHGKPWAAIVPLDHVRENLSAPSILDLAGSGAGLWDMDAAAYVDMTREEWE